MTERAPLRTPNGVQPNHRAFEDDAGGQCSSVACSECNGLMAPEDVRSVDNVYVYCDLCTEALCAPLDQGPSLGFPDTGHR